MLGVMATINQEFDKDAIELICSEYGVEVEEKVSIDVSDLEAFIARGFRRRINENVHLSLQLWVTLTMGKQHYWIQFVIQKLQQGKLVELHSILVLIKLKSMVRRLLS